MPKGKHLGFNTKQNGLCSEDTIAAVIMIAVIIGFVAPASLLHVQTLLFRLVRQVLVCQKYKHQASEDVETVIIYLVLEVNCGTRAIIINVGCALSYEAISVSEYLCASIVHPRVKPEVCKQVCHLAVDIHANIWNVVCHFL